MKIGYVLMAMVPVGAAAALVLVERGHQEAELRGMREKIAALSTSVETSRRRAEDKEDACGLLRGLAAQPPTPQLPAPSAAAAPAPRPEPEAPQLEQEEARSRLNVVFDGERADAEWAPRAQSKAEGRIAAALPETSTLRSVECRSSMCRFETVHEDLDSYQQFVHSAFLDPAKQVWNGGFFTTLLTDSGNGKLVTVSYLAREGEDLPPLM